MRFWSCKTISAARLSMWKIVHIKEQTYSLLIIAWYGGRNFTKLILKFLAIKNNVSISTLCISPFPEDYTISVYIMTTLHWFIYIAALAFLINWNKKWCSKSNLLNMDHLFLKIPLQLLFTHCQISLSIWRPQRISISG